MNDQQTQQPIGQQIRDLRKAKGISTVQLAKVVGKSTGFINNVERSRTEVSLSVLNRISDALDVQVSWFFQGYNSDAPQETGLVVRNKHHRQLKLTAAGVYEELLSPTVASNVQMIRTVFAPGASTGEATVTTAAEMTGVILSGVLTLQIEEKWLQLQTGDSFLVPKNATRRCVNHGSEESVSIWVITPAVY